MPPQEAQDTTATNLLSDREKIIDQAANLGLDVKLVEQRFNTVSDLFTTGDWKDAERDLLRRTALQKDVQDLTDIQNGKMPDGWSVAPQPGATPGAGASNYSNGGLGIGMSLAVNRNTGGFIGVKVVVTANSPASEVGLQTGDIIIKVGDINLDGNNVCAIGDLQDELLKTPLGSKVPLLVRRDSPGKPGEIIKVYPEMKAGFTDIENTGMKDEKKLDEAGLKRAGEQKMADGKTFLAEDVSLDRLIGEHYIWTEKRASRVWWHRRPRTVDSNVEWDAPLQFEQGVPVATNGAKIKGDGKGCLQISNSTNSLLANYGMVYDPASKSLIPYVPPTGFAPGMKPDGSFSTDKYGNVGVYKIGNVRLSVNNDLGIEDIAKDTSTMVKLLNEVQSDVIGNYIQSDLGGEYIPFYIIEPSRNNPWYVPQGVGLNQSMNVEPKIVYVSRNDIRKFFEK